MLYAESGLSANTFSRHVADDKWDSVYAQRIAEYRKGDLKGKALISWKYQQYMRDYLATVLSYPRLSRALGNGGDGRA